MFYSCDIQRFKIFIQIAAIVLPPEIVEIIEPVVQARVGTDRYVVRLHIQDILLIIHTL